MGNRGPKISENKNISSNGQTGAAFLTSAGCKLSDAEKKIWDETVKAMAPGFYRKSDIQLLKQYCQAVILRDKYKKKMDDAEEKDDFKTADIYEQRWIRMFSLILSSSPKLKIGPASRETHRQATKASSKGIIAAKSAREDLMYG